MKSQKRYKMPYMVVLLLNISFLSACGGSGGSDIDDTSSPSNNISPSASAGSDQSVYSLASVKLTGNGTDIDGSIVSYAWSQTAGASVVINKADEASVNFDAPNVTSQTTLNFKLVVTDDDGSTGSDTVSIIVLPSVITSSDVEHVALGFGELMVSNLPLYNGLPNAREKKKSVHYISNTGHDSSKSLVPIRSYVAACNSDTDEPRMFVSLTVSDSLLPGAPTYGSVYEAKYDPITKSLQPQSNSALLPQCYQSHGIAVNKDCSRVAVLCSKDYGASSKEPHDGDLVSGQTIWTTPDDHNAIDQMIANHYGYFIAIREWWSHKGWFSSNTELADIETGLKNGYPSAELSEWNDLMSEEGWMTYILYNVLTTEQLNDLIAFTKAEEYSENGELWLLEWDGSIPLSDTPSTSHVVATNVDSETHGHLNAGTKALIYTENDKNGPSYGFATTSRHFVPYNDASDRKTAASSHTSGMMVVIERDSWSVNLNSRGFAWACGFGHVLNMRVFYDPYEQEYNSLCTSDGYSSWFDWNSNDGKLGSIAIKSEVRSIGEGAVLHYVPSNNTFTTNGGGHKTIPVSADTSVTVLVAPRLIDPVKYNEFVTQFLMDPEFFNSSQMVDTSVTPGPYHKACESSSEGDNCFDAYLNMAKATGSYADAYDHYESYIGTTTSLGGSDDPLDNRSLSRIGFFMHDKTYQYGKMDGSGVEWIVEDSDCQISDPQLVDLKNGRFLLGFAKFHCISEQIATGEGYGRYGEDAKSLIPQACYLMEVDVNGDVLEGPTEVPNHCWGGLDDVIYMGKGRVGWVYKPDPIYSTNKTPQVSNWELMIYTSNSVNP